MKKPKNSPEPVYGAWHGSGSGRAWSRSGSWLGIVWIELLYRYRSVLLMSFMLFSVFLLFAIESVFNGGFTFSLRILWAPWALLIVGFGGWNYDFLARETRSRWRPWLFAILTYPVVLLMSWPYVMALNAVTGSGTTVIYEGPIMEKRITGGRHPGHVVEILNKQSAELVTLRCSEARYHQLSEGDVFRETFFVGGFGIPYRWKFGEKEPSRNGNQTR
ncbi:MAG: hypothetical protein EOP84_05620 [Verrucomicrobiaceae bacterium]|nr:MAG: hypothetical protein EOP84_05620 [Verrucomicrobiaceae bacterium]